MRATENPARAGHDQEEGGAEGVVCCQSFEYSLKWATDGHRLHVKYPEKLFVKAIFE